VTLRIVGGDEKGSLKSETVKYGHESQGTRTRERLLTLTLITHRFQTSVCTRIQLYNKIEQETSKSHTKS
jgi:hypothetical protein